VPAAAREHFIRTVLTRHTKERIVVGCVSDVDADGKALTRAGLDKYFTAGVMSCAELQTSKRTPDVFFLMTEKLGSLPQETIVFEDALYASITAKKAGFSVAAVYDPSEKKQEILRETADWYCRSWEELPLEIL
jgi:beta-phosphoglucomutase-like phosphatase (HAD superfamily)